MAVVGPDGTPTEAGSKILLAIKSGLDSLERISQMTGLPVFVVKNGLRDMERMKLVKRWENGYELDEKGKELLR